MQIVLHREGGVTALNLSEIEITLKIDGTKVRL